MPDITIEMEWDDLPESAQKAVKESLKHEIEEDFTFGVWIKGVYVSVEVDDHVEKQFTYEQIVDEIIHLKTGGCENAIFKEAVDNFIRAAARLKNYVQNNPDLG